MCCKTEIVFKIQAESEMIVAWNRKLAAISKENDLKIVVPIEKTLHPRDGMSESQKVASQKHLLPAVLGSDVLDISGMSLGTTATDISNQAD
jgi:hypothetical protein